MGVQTVSKAPCGVEGGQRLGVTGEVTADAPRTVVRCHRSDLCDVHVTDHCLWNAVI